MDLLQRLLGLCLPTLRIRPQWRSDWERRDQHAFLTAARVLLALSAIAYFLHLVYIDPALPLDRTKNWQLIRIIPMSTALAGLVGTFIPFIAHGWLARLMLVVFGVSVVWTQSYSMMWHPAVHYAYSIVMTLIPAVVLRLSVIPTAIYMLCGYAIQYSAWLGRPDEFFYIFSAAVVGLVVAAAFRSRMHIEVSAFIAERENLEAQAKLIQAELEMSEQIRAFLPKEIFTRFSRLRSRQRFTALQAIDEVLRSRRENVTCLHSDIRGFTKLTKRSLEFVKEEAVPDIRAGTEVVETFGGIPRLIGDLLFAYFDGDAERGLLRGLSCALELSRKHASSIEFQRDEKRVRRFVLVSYGEAVVGNIGGSDSSRDITVLGNPANILSRIDPLTKEPGLKDKLSHADIILTNDAFQVLSKTVQLSATRLELSPLGMRIRDFEEEQTLWVVKSDEKNRTLVENALEAQGWRQGMDSDIWEDSYAAFSIG